VALSRSEIRDLLERHDLGPSRALGQNFLCDQGTVDKIVRLSGIDATSNVLEIGPGLGSLTVGLCRTGARVVAVEIDRHLIPALRERTGRFEESGRLTVINADVRDLDWTEVLGDRNWTVVANLPYNIATPLVLDLLVEQPRLRRWLVMVQREAGERLVARPGSKIYGIPSVLLAYWAEARLVASVSADLFFPKPNVESVLVEIIRREACQSQDGPDRGEFDRVAHLVRAAFNQRRKMLRRSLAGRVDASQFDAAGIQSTRRPEELGVDEWRRLAAVARPPVDRGR
jgi:16S rRNA (adenine1518-N6/adenine1519-N6)-dimethyltransferase